MTANEIWEKHKQVIPGGVVSLNRIIDPMRVFVRAKGAYLWDSDGKQYIDYHAAFSPYLLGHSDTDVDEAVIRAIREERSLMGAGTTPWEGELAELLVECIPTLDQVQLTNTGSEATFLALRLARAVTERDKVIIMQGGYNGWHNDVAFNLMDSADQLADSREGEELPLSPLTAGMPKSAAQNVHVVQFNDLAAVENVMRRGNIAAVILEPILQNIGIVKPKPGYLNGLRRLCDQYGSLLVFDEVKTGFRHALGGYQSICGVRPDLSSFGKAVANGYPLGVIGGKREYMEYFNHPEPAKRVLIAGTYNAHPVPTVAAIATLRKLKTQEGEIYAHLERLGQMMEDGLKTRLARHGFPATVARQGSAFVVYFMDASPENWLDIARYNDMERDKKYRQRLIDAGVFHFPLPTKQGSISFAHTETDIERTLEITDTVLSTLARN
ncbi:MAG: aspartate aminotransferase family protein [Candidatus Poribacteria bacterium]|nr:aspartate aminotransferase family protein [Candidatus Poribacteria bacterium]